MRLVEIETLFRFAGEQKVKETGMFTKGQNKAWNTIRSMCHSQDGFPTVDAEPVIHAHWELEVRFPSGIEWRKCSRCGRQVNTQDDMDCVEQFPYCHCGAKMDEGVFDDTETICEADDGHGGTAQ